MGFNDYSFRILKPLTGDTPWVPMTPWLTPRRVHTCILVIPQARRMAGPALDTQLTQVRLHHGQVPTFISICLVSRL